MVTSQTRSFVLNMPMILLSREAAYAMISYIHPAPNLLYDPPIIDASAEGDRLIMLEVGSGSGLVASTLAGLLRPGHDRLIVTDLPEVCLASCYLCGG